MLKADTSILTLKAQMCEKAPHGGVRVFGALGGGVSSIDLIVSVSLTILSVPLASVCHMAPSNLTLKVKRLKPQPLC